MTAWAGDTRVVCSVIGCNKTGTEERTPPGFTVPEHLCEAHAQEYDHCADQEDYVCRRLVY
jgi:hypothetical protein